MRARLPARAICIESPQSSASRAAACRSPTFRPLAGDFIAKSWQRWYRVRAMVSALAQGLGLTHLTGCAQTPRSLQSTGALGGRPVISRAARRCKTQRQQDVVVAVAAKPVPTMVTETPKVKEVKQSGASKHDLTPEVATDLYRDMQLGRIFEDKCAEMYYRGKMFGFVHLYSGQEAVSTGVIRHLRRDDYICSTYRDHVHALSKDVPAREIMAELFGKKTGICRGQGGSMHMFSSKYNLLGGFAFIGEGIPIGLGAAFQIKYRKEVLGEENANQVAINFFGDGTCNVGQFYECMNMASLYKLPCIFVVENNKWAIGMYHPRATGPTEGDNEPYIYKKGPAFGMPGVLVDGMDVMKVREVAAEAIARARRGDGPTLIEAETYRFRGHSLADPDELRQKEEKDHYAARDPIPQFRDFVLKQSILNEAQIKDIDREVEAVVDEAVKFADESPKPEKGQLLENVFADPKGFGIAPDGRYRYELPGFSSGTAAVS